MGKALIIVGSRREGNSLNLANKIKEELKKDRITSYIIVPGNQKIHLCTGCMDCDENGVCDFTDDMEKNIDKVLECETLIFITPTRWNLLSGDIKIFMDRLNPLYSNKKLKDKKMVSIAIGSTPKDVYSNNDAVKSLTNFAESSQMNSILTYEFNNCLDFNDILKQEDNINKLIEKIKIITK
ncbi:MAG: flavodoxin family protein [Bacilli bacterium]|nr:flavodoxin family protein [Bacilli bacterium]